MLGALGGPQADFVSRQERRRHSTLGAMDFVVVVVGGDGPRRATVATDRGRDTCPKAVRLNPRGKAIAGLGVEVFYRPRVVPKALYQATGTDRCTQAPYCPAVTQLKQVSALGGWEASRVPPPAGAPVQTQKAHVPQAHGRAGPSSSTSASSGGPAQSSWSIPLGPSEGLRH